MNIYIKKDVNEKAIDMVMVTGDRWRGGGTTWGNGRRHY